MDPFDVVVVGSLNLDLVARTGRLPGPGETVTGSSYAEYPGGKGLNQAVAAARSGARVAMVGALGDDHAGARLRAVLAAEGIDDAAVARLAGVATGRAVISVADDAENSIIVVPGANGEVTIDTNSLPRTRVVLAQLEIPIGAVAEAFAAARASGTTTVLNPAPAIELPDDLLATCDVVVPNEHELDLIGGSEHLFDRGVHHVVVTLGAAGAELRSGDGSVRRVEPFEVDPVDTTGAGDAFCGVLARRLAAGDPVVDALDHAAAAGALATTVAGAVPSQPKADAIAALIRGRRVDQPQ